MRENNKPKCNFYPLESYNSIGMKLNLTNLIIIYLDTFAFTFADLPTSKGLK